MESGALAAQAAPALRRVATRWEIVALSLNDVIGSGVYLLPAAAAAMLGAASLWAVVAAGFAVLLIVLCFAEAGSYFDRPGGAYLYARTAFGDLVGFEVGWMTWLARVASVASLSAGFAQALGYLLPGARDGLGRTAAIALPLYALTVINVAGVKWGVRTAVALAIGKIVPLVVFVAAGAFAVSWSRLATVEPIPGAGSPGEAALLLLFAYAGFENTPAPAGEYRNPRRDVPFALLTQIVLVTLIYSAVQLVALGTLPNIATSETPLADAARLFLGGWGGWLLTVGAALSILGTNGNTMFSGPRYAFALATDGFGPAALARVHARFRTPANAVVLQAAVALPLALSGTFVQLAALSVIARLATYLGTAAAVPLLRRRFAAPPPASGTAAHARSIVRLPGGPAIPIAAILFCMALAASAGPANLVAGAVALAVGLLLFLLRQREPVADTVEPTSEVLEP